VVFWTLPGSGRKLLCDIWQPPAGVRPSGLAFLYFHGSAWTMLDKDYGTRPFFRYLTGQGHLVMDVAYRLSPETAIPGMVGDVKRAVAWMKCNAARYGANPEKIVLGGGSAGGHISLLAAYAPNHPDLTPVDVKGEDLSVRAVISEYGPSDLAACYYHTNQDKTTRNRPVRPAKENPGMARLMRKIMGDRYERLGFDKSMDAGSFYQLIGGHPDEMLDRYALLSPVTHVCAGCPPTLLIQGEDDLITSVEATRVFAQKLRDAGVPVISVVFPQTDHGFDLMLPDLSPSAQAALYDIERFLALMAC
jgi:acetyl esterase/lipase